ncbi:Animal haem peroxidase [Ancylobacter rudongensis]|uniref:Animal haem peroxidase n=2 Tax=Ancylobacter rudongensis TaxID=177413 RepID=A0A1G4PRW7_9HYPH|nr:Animal haem peroxidase [Ancylobacter rudongensis]
MPASRQLVPGEQGACTDDFDKLIEAVGHAVEAVSEECRAQLLPVRIEVREAVTAKPSNPAGFTFLGQFIDHDLTEFRVIGEGYKIIPQNPTIGQRQLVLEDVRHPERDLPTTTNGRSGKLDLDSVYGLLGTPQLNLFSDEGLFLHNVQTDAAGNALPPDLQRGDAHRNKRLIADPRNDENKLITQVHLLFERLHNKIHGDTIAAFRQNQNQARPQVERDQEVRESFGPTSSNFEATKKRVQSIYRRIVAFDYLPRIVQRSHLDEVLAQFADSRKKTFFEEMNARNDDLLKRRNLGGLTVEAVAIPVEFSHAVFRLGHSQLRNQYLLHAGFGSRLFNTATDSHDLRGDKPLYVPATATAPELVFHVDWTLFFKAGANDPQHGEPIDGRLPEAIFRLPPPAIGEPPQSLAERNIRRGVDFGLPSGQSVASQLAARYKGVAPTSAEALFPTALYGRFVEVLEREPRLRWDTPLWYYMLMEAAAYTDTPQLGPVGGYVVAETILGALLEGETAETDLSLRPGAIAAEARRLRADWHALNVDWDETASDKRRWDQPLATPDAIISMGQLIAFVGA